MSITGISDLVADIDGRLDELETECAQLKLARAALVQRTPARVVSRRRRSGSNASKPSYEMVPVGQLIALLSDSPGMSTRELSRATNGDPGQVLTLLKEQEVADRVRRTGTRAATRWRVITDEDRIAARAAELAARPSNRRVRARKN